MARRGLCWQLIMAGRKIMADLHVGNSSVVSILFKSVIYTQQRLNNSKTGAYGTDLVLRKHHLIANLLNITEVQWRRGFI